MSVSGRVAIVAGFGNAVGNAIALRLAQENAHVVIGGEDPDAVSRASGELNGWQPATAMVPMDPADSHGVERLVQTALQEYGRLDIAVSAWNTPSRLLLEQTGGEEIERILSVNLRAALYLGRSAAVAMKSEKYGRIVNISSRDWLGGEVGYAYAAACAGVVGLTRTLAWELVQQGITANCVAPGLIQDEVFGALPPAEADELLRAQPVRRPGTPAEVAQAVLFFAADEAGFITGQTLYVCGGKSALSSLTA